MVEASILILAKNEEGNIRKCLDAVFSQNFNFEKEVVFIDSGSRDKTVAIAESYPILLHRIPAEQFHHARTRNLAASLSCGKYLVYLAADAFPASNLWLQSLISNFQDDSVKAVYGRHLPKPGSQLERQHALGTLYGPDRIVKDPQSRDRLGYRYFHFSTVNAAIRREIWEATRFPEEFKVFEDVAIAKRMLDRGWTLVYEPNAAVYHSHDYPARLLLRRYFDIGVVYNQLGIWTTSSKSSLRSDGITKVREKMRSMRFGQIRSTSQALWNDAAKTCGLILGRRERYLPYFLKRRLSAFRLYDR